MPVRGRATDRSPPNSTVRECRRQKNAFGTHFDICDLKNIYAKESQPQNKVDILEETSIRGSGHRTRMPMPTPKSKQCHQPNSFLLDKSDPQGSWLFEQGCTSVDAISGVTTCQTSDTKVPALRSKPEIVDLSGGFCVHESYIDAKLASGESRWGESINCSPFGSFISEKLTCCKSFSTMDCQGSAICSKVELGPTKPNLSLNSEPREMPPESFPVASSDREVLFLDLLVPENVSKYEENRSKSRPANANHKKLEAGKQICSNEAEDRTLELKESPVTENSVEHSEETSSSVKIADSRQFRS